MVSPRRIRALAPQLANQIAAGEVVERPASVVKELIENSLDAGAGSVDIEIERGGTRLIRVRDDGSGIAPEDLPLALSRHATSKIVEQGDLLGIRTLGFRGEALASIASVSRFSLTSRGQNEAQGWRLTSEAAEAVPAAHPPGTTVEVRDLFYNTAARRKFLRSERTEFIHLEEVVRRLVLSRFGAAFQLRHDGRRLLTLPAATAEDARERRVATLLGKAFLDQALRVGAAAGGLQLQGWAGGTGYTRSQADHQYFFLNGRIIRDRLVAHAVRQAYRDVIEAGRHPAYVLYLTLDPEQVDVNVHPTKHEVRFRESRSIHDFLFTALAAALREDAPALRRPTVAGAALPERPVPEIRERRAGDYWQRVVRPGFTEALPAIPSGEGVVAVDDRYLLLPTAGEVRVVDVRRGWERLIKQRLSEATEPVRRRPLLIPAAVELPAGARRRLLALQDELLPLGIEVEGLDDRTVVLRQVPALMPEVDPGALVAGLAEVASPTRDTLIAVIARLGAEARECPRSRAQVEALLRELELLEVSAEWSAPLTGRDMARLFGRGGA